MRGMNSDCVDLIYADPPFNSNRNYEAPIGSDAAGAAFKDMWTLNDVDVYEHGELADRNPGAYAVIEAARQTHGKGMMAYCIFMAIRLMEMHRILKHAGSIYLHCDPTAGAYLKLLIDSVFGVNNFRNEIIWCYTGPSNTKKWFPRKHDTIWWYAKSDASPFYHDAVRVSYTKLNTQQGKGIGGDLNPDNIKSYMDKGKIPESWWSKFSPVGRLKKERTGYPTQKPLALLERIIKASSNEGDMVFDPFCGCATSLVAADRLQRQWAGIDLSPLAVKLVNERIIKDRGPLFSGAIALDEPPIRTDLGDIPNYRTHRHRLYGEQEGVCVGCDTHFPFRVMDVDHILPRSRGGTDHMDNLQLLCSGCNRSKGNKTRAEWKAMQ